MRAVLIGIAALIAGAPTAVAGEEIVRQSGLPNQVRISQPDRAGLLARVIQPGARNIAVINQGPEARRLEMLGSDPPPPAEENGSCDFTSGSPCPREVTVPRQPVPIGRRHPSRLKSEPALDLADGGGGDARALLGEDAANKHGRDPVFLQKTRSH